MKPAPFEYHAPESVEEAVALLAEFAPQNGRVLAGGQSLVPAMAFRLARPAHLIDINGIAALAQLSLGTNELTIGASVRHAAFHQPITAAPLGRLLSEVVRHIAHDPIRRRGTFCGSIAHADPASEWCCVAATLGATIVARAASGTRQIRAADFFTGVMTTALADDELLVQVKLPLLPADTRSGFVEFSRRAGDFAIAMALATYRVENGRIAEPRLGIGGVESRPRRVVEAERVLQGGIPNAECFAAAATEAARAVTPMSDPMISADYRRDLVASLARRALEQAI
ncbi:MAG TPA: FAD binding domain-containing protein [Stellaceae bacterium]|nr:FAD binding domain-containing protein [Stellaceae bacterium]